MLLNIKSVLGVIIGKIAVVRVLLDVVLPGQKRSFAPQLKYATLSIHYGNFVHRHQFCDDLSRGEIYFFKYLNRMLKIVLNRIQKCKKLLTFGRLFDILPME